MIFFQAWRDSVDHFVHADYLLPLGSTYEIENFSFPVPDTDDCIYCITMHYSSGTAKAIK